MENRVDSVDWADVAELSPREAVGDKEDTMRRKGSHFVRNALLVACCYVALIVVAWIAIGVGAAAIAAVGAGALIALGLPPLIIYEEEHELFHPDRHPGR